MKKTLLLFASLAILAVGCSGEELAQKDAEIKELKAKISQLQAEVAEHKKRADIKEQQAITAQALAEELRKKYEKK